MKIASKIALLKQTRGIAITQPRTSDPVLEGFARDVIATLNELVADVTQTKLVTSDYVIMTTDRNLFVDHVSSVIIGLPSNRRRGHRVSVFDASGNASTYNVSIVGNTSYLINNTSRYIMATDKSAVTIVCDGTHYYVESEKA